MVNKINMELLKKYRVEATVLLLIFICLGLYFLLVKPVMIKRQAVIKETEGKTARLRRYRQDPPSPEKIDKLKQKQELLENQYQEIIKTLCLIEQEPLPEEIGQLHLYFEEQVDKIYKNLNYLEKKTGIEIPDRLGFKKEKPVTREELFALLNQLISAKELVSLTAETGVSQLSSLTPLSLSKDRFIKVSGQPLFEELEFELVIVTDISILTELIYRLNNSLCFFTVNDLKIRSVTASVRSSESSVSRRRGESRRRTERTAPDVNPGELFERNQDKDKTVKNTELEVTLFVSSYLLVHN